MILRAIWELAQYPNLHAENQVDVDGLPRWLPIVQEAASSPKTQKIIKLI
jgi:hypothetical protein